MPGLFRRAKRTTGVVVAAAAVVAGLGIASGVETLGGAPVLVASAAVLGLGYVAAVVVGLGTARQPQAVAYLVVAGGGLLVLLSAVADVRGILATGALLLLVAGGLLYRAGQEPEEATA